MRYQRSSTTRAFEAAPLSARSRGQARREASATPRMAPLYAIEAAERRSDNGSTAEPGLSEQAIADRAREIWEDQGRPEGRDLDHWIVARLELNFPSNLVVDLLDDDEPRPALSSGTRGGARPSEDVAGSA